jgi:hypothetical protein
MSTPLKRLLLTLAAAAALHGTTSIAIAQSSETRIFLELNDTDGDLGINASIDGDAWTELRIDGAGGRMLEVVSRGRLRTQGLTQLTLESAKPSLPPAEFLRRFTEGRYQVTGRRLNGSAFTSASQLSHVLAAPPGNIFINGVRAAASCGAPPPTVVAPVTVEWDPVTRAHPTIGKRGTVTINRYQVFAEGTGVGKVAVDLPRTRTSFRIPSEGISGGLNKLTIIARTSSGNQTAVETCFRVS